MTLYRYTALSPIGETVQGELDAGSKADIVEDLLRRGLLPVEADEVGRGGFLAVLQRDLFAARKPSLRHLGIITHELATLLQAGMPLDRSLATLIDVAESKQGKRVLEAILERVRDGATLTDALRETGAFPRYYTSMIRAGEAAGALDSVLFSLVDFLTKSLAAREAVKSALVYPAILMVTAGASVTLIITVVLPEFEPFFKDAGAALPLATRLVFAVGEVVRSYWWLLLGGAMACVLAVMQAIKNPALELRLHRAALRVPVLKDVVGKGEAARLGRTLGTLVANGVALPNALEITSGTLANKAMANAIADVAAGLKEGQGLAEPLAATALFPPLAIHLIRVGEETGHLDKMLVKLADIYDRDVQRLIERLLAVLVPLLTIGLGALIAGLIASVLIAILSINTLVG